METRIESAICTGCACLCDDIDVTVVDGSIFQAANVCLWGASKFLAHKRFHPKKERRRLSQPQVRRRGLWQGLTYEAALAEAAEMLSRARRPLIYGLTNSGSWAQEAALALARRLRARLEPADLAFKGPYFQNLINYGLFWAPLEVIRDEADTVLFWGANPLHSCPRHVVRYSIFARGRFTETGIEERHLAAVDIYRTELAGMVELFVQMEPGQELALLRNLLAGLNGGPAAPVKGGRRLTALLREASYGVLFFGRGVSYGAPGEVLENLAALTARLNEAKPFVLFPLSADYNSAGLYQVLLRETGSAGAPDFGAGAEGPASYEPIDLAEADALLVVGADLFWTLSGEEIRELQRRRVPVVALSPFANRTTGHADVAIPVALAGVETPELAYRMDGLPVPLPKLMASSLWPDVRVLRELTALL